MIPIRDTTAIPIGTVHSIARTTVRTMATDLIMAGTGDGTVPGMTPGMTLTGDLHIGGLLITGDILTGMAAVIIPTGRPDSLPALPPALRASIPERTVTAVPAALTAAQAVRPASMALPVTGGLPAATHPAVPRPAEALPAETTPVSPVTVVPAAVIHRAALPAPATTAVLPAAHPAAVIPAAAIHPEEAIPVAAIRPAVTAAAADAGNSVLTLTLQLYETDTSDSRYFVLHAGRVGSGYRLHLLRGDAQP